MKIYSDHLVTNDLIATARRVGVLYLSKVTPMPRPRVRRKGWEVQTYGVSNRWKFRSNRSRTGAAVNPATLPMTNRGVWSRIIILQTLPGVNTQTRSTHDERHPRQ